jgi:bifunctional non-homologous end joining protein LigD
LFHFAELCALTLHTSAVTADATDFPNVLFIDLDPFGVPFAAVQRVALFVKSMLDELALRSYVKTSGASGLHIYIPLIEKRFTYDQVRLFAAGIAKAAADRHPEMMTIERLIRNRTGKVYIDFSQNGRGRTRPPSIRPGLGEEHQSLCPYGGMNWKATSTRVNSRWKRFCGE